jgi:hypothetical protein
VLRRRRRHRRRARCAPVWLRARAHTLARPCVGARRFRQNACGFSLTGWAARVSKRRPPAPAAAPRQRRWLGGAARPLHATVVPRARGWSASPFLCWVCAQLVLWSGVQALCVCLPAMLSSLSQPRAEPASLPFSKFTPLGAPVLAAPQGLLRARPKLRAPPLLFVVPAQTMRIQTLSGASLQALCARPAVRWLRRRPS